MKLILTAVLAAASSLLVSASPRPGTTLELRQTSASASSNQRVRAVRASLNTKVTRINNAFQSSNFPAIVAELRALAVLDPGPTSVQDAIAELEAISVTNLDNLYGYIANLVALNLTSNLETLFQYAKGALNQGKNGMQNMDRNPPYTVYPRSSADAPYSVPESSLRSAIYIPTGFTFGRIPPVILFPGSGSTGYTAFSGNFIPLLQGSDFADPVWVNVPGYLLDDIQVNAEYAAYAMNYIAAITGTNVTILAWSQGTINVHWAHKFWPSSRCITSDHVAISGDYAGSIEANIATPPGFPISPSVYQQRYLSTSRFITTLRADNGDSGYVPTTNIYSGFIDELIRPQQGTGASAYLNDAHGVGVTNYEVQTVCPGQAAGSFYTHESMLVNPLSFALLRDAMTHPGPGNFARLDLPSVCSRYAATGLNLADVLTTEDSVVIAGLAILLYPNKVTAEPALKPYASSPTVANYNCNA